MSTRRQPGAVRDAIIRTLSASKAPVGLDDIISSVRADLGDEVPASSVRSYLQLNTPGRFVRTGRATYQLAGK